MSELGIEDFPRFMEETTGFAPFPWQSRLARQVSEGASSSAWPELLDLPTGAGKTSAIHVAVFALALRPTAMPRRIVLVVDRRVIVDQVHEVSSRLASKLASARDGTTARVAARLKALCAAENPTPLRATLLRGGIPRDDSWIHAPDQPTIFASTVDQVGSRLLFRGYGVSPSMRPIHAGILGTDTLYLLDEVHLASAFEKALSDIRAYQQPKWREHEGELGRPIQVVRMSATPRANTSTSSVFSLDEADHEHPVLRQRLAASRPARMELVKTKATKDATRQNRELIAGTAVDAAVGFAQQGARLIGIVMNRVALAVATAKKLEDTHPGRVLLVTGRMRALERVRVQDAINVAAASGAERSGVEPTYVVATSCIEAGADYDFDALVTQVASLPALRQRFGRLNRLGKNPDAVACILGSKHELSKSAKPDPIYGESLARTWRFLEERATDGTIDFGLTVFPEIEAAEMDTLRTALVAPPTMFPSYLDMWAETRPEPHPDPDVSLWLHGKDHEVDADISLVFRADITPPTSEDWVDPVTAESLDFMPPLAEEALAVPTWQLRKFVESRSSEESGPCGEQSVLVWTSEGAVPKPIGQIRPGDTVVLPTSWGGLTMESWDPDSRELARDIGERAYAARHAQGHSRAGLRLRISDRVLPTAPSLPAPPSQESADDPEAWEQAHDDLRRWLGSPIGKSDWLVDLLEMAQTLEPDIRQADSGRSWLVSWQLPGRGINATTDDVISSYAGLEVSLSGHLEDVRAWAHGFAERAGLAQAVADDIALAAWLHDMGKADPRFQAMLRGGDYVKALSADPLAKSKAPGSPKRREIAQARSGWPPGFRHELISLALLESSESIQATAHDIDLVRHLVASHHGWCRPWSPALDDEAPIAVRFTFAGEALEVDTSAIDDRFRFECASRFHRLCRRYGWHGLAYLEALLRLGDHQASRIPASRPTELSQ